MNKYPFAAFFLVILFSFSAIAQVDEAGSGKKTFSISDKNNTSSASTKFEFNRVKTEGSTFNASYKDYDPPQIKLTEPRASRGVRVREWKEKMLVSGIVVDQSKIAEMTINGRSTELQDGGLFNEFIQLQTGQNSIEIVAKDVYGNEAKRIIKVDRSVNRDPIIESGSDNQVEWLNLDQNATSTSKHISIEFCVQSKLELIEVNIYHNEWKLQSLDWQNLLGNKKCQYHWSAGIDLKNDLNQIRVEVRTKQGTFSSTREVIYKPDIGRYVALIIAVEDYKDDRITDLDEPIRDANKLYKTLNEKYLFEKKDITLLKNPNKSEIIKTLHALRSQVRSSDNLLIFYAGHGFWDKDMKTGFWLPADAEEDNPVNWIPNTDITNYLGSIHSKHTLIITDACFSGGIFKTRAAFKQNPGIQKLYEMPSRKAMTSGTLKEVPDKSIFMKYLLLRLEQNQESFLSAEQLYSSLRLAVLNNSPNIPQYGTIRNVGDEGGDFIFIKR